MKIMIFNGLLLFLLFMWTSAETGPETEGTEELQAYANESRVDIQARKRACENLSGRCIKNKKDCPLKLRLETKPGRPYCSKKHRCCYPEEGQIIAPDDLENVPWNLKECQEKCERKPAQNGYVPEYKWCYTNLNTWSYCGCPNMWFEKQHVCEENECNDENTFLTFMKKQRPAKSINIYGESYVATRNGAPVYTNTVFKKPAGVRINYRAYMAKTEIACIMEEKFVAWECKFYNGEWRTCRELEGISAGFGYLSNGHYIGRTT